MQYPKNYERLVLLNLADTDEGADFRPLAAGVMSRSHNLQEKKPPRNFMTMTVVREMTALRQARHRLSGGIAQPATRGRIGSSTLLHTTQAAGRSSSSIGCRRARHGAAWGC